MAKRRMLLGCVTVTSCVLGAGLVIAPSTMAASNTVTVTGGGWGHGVGLSQYGALGMAKEGRTASQIIKHYFTGVAVSKVTDNRIIRVNIGHALAGARIRSKALASGGGRMQVVIDGKLRVLTIGDQIALTASGAKTTATVYSSKGVKRWAGTGKVVTVNWAGTRVPGSTGKAATAVQLGRSSSGSWRTSTLYRYGNIDVATVSGRLEVVNLVRLHDEYLYGIAEIPASWPTAAQQAQAIAARSYALANTATRASCRCQSDDGSGPWYDQTFIGYARETSYLGKNWRTAVARTATSSTAGQTATYKGKAIHTFYFSSSGGRTENSADVWGGALPYAKSVDDHWSKDPKINTSGNAKWSSTRSRASVAAAFGLPDVAKIAVTSRTAGGSARVVTATSSKGKVKTMSGSKFAGVMGLRAKWIFSIAVK